MDHETLPPIIIADPDMEFLQAMKSDTHARAVPPLIIHDERTVLQNLAESTQPFSGLFINPKVGEPHGISVIREALKKHPAMPVFYLIDPRYKTLPEKDLQALTVRKVIEKPVRYLQMLKAIQEVPLAFSPEDALRHAAKHSDPLNEEAQADDKDFLAISAANFISGSACFFDVYVRLKPGKYVKILKAGDAFAPDRASGYIKKGVKHFYLRRETQEAYLKYCDHLTTNILKNDRVPTEIKVSVTANQGEEVTSFLKSRGVEEAAIQHAERFVENVHNLSELLKHQNNSALNKFLEDLERVEHGVAITMIASFLAQPLQFEAEKSVQIIGLASLTHDIGLQDMDPKFLSEDEREWEGEDSVLYRSHPEKGAAMLSGLRNIEPTVIQAVLQHHERRSRTGFPNRVGAGALNRVSEIVGISDELHKLIRQSKGPKGFDLATRLELTIHKEFSSPVVEAFRKAFKF